MQMGRTLQEILGRMAKISLEHSRLFSINGGVKIANSFPDLEKVLGWEAFALQCGSNKSLQETIQPLFEKDYLRSHGHSIVLTLDGFLRGLEYLDREKESLEIRK